MCDFLIHKGLKYRVASIGMEMTEDPNSSIRTVKQTESNEKQYSEEVLKLSEETKDKTFYEPIWIFEK